MFKQVFKLTADQIRDNNQRGGLKVRSSIRAGHDWTVIVITDHGQLRS